MISAALLARSLASLLVVVALLLLFIWGLRRGMLRVGPFAPRTNMVIETAMALGDRRSLVIVAVEGRRLLLGLSGGGISLLTDLAASSEKEGMSR
jgi:flagellar biogenesis protein FliO